MSLRFRLTLSYLVVVIIFVGVFVLSSRVVWPSYGFPRVLGSFPADIQQILARQLPGEQTLAEIRRLPGMEHARLEILSREKARGSTNSVVRGAARGKVVMRPLRGMGFQVAGPMQGPDGSSCCLHIVMRPPPPPGPPPHLSHQFGDVRFRELLRAVSFGVVTASLVCLSLGLFLSSKLSGPVADLVRATRDLTPDNLESRVEVEGVAELGALASSFNQMADRLTEALRHAEEERDRARRSEASRREFLADVSHNLRTPLTAAQGWLDALIEGVVAGEEDEYLRRTRREILHVSKTVQRLLDLSRWEGRIPEFAHEAVDFQEILMEVVESLEESALSRRIELSLSEVEPGLRVNGDRLRLRELLQVLLENAVEHAGEGSRLRLSTNRQGNRVKVQVADNGKGFPDREIEFLTERYRSPGGGVGLGLAIAAKIVTAHGGKLLLGNGSEGAEVTFDLPLAHTDSEP